MDMSIWFLIGAILVFFMQCGFAMVETGFTRAKNAGNIIMKNLMDFCIGTVVFIFLGYGLMMGDHGEIGLIGKPEWGMFLDFEASTGRALSSSWFSVRQLQRLFPGRWRSAQSFPPTVSILPSSAWWSIRLRPAGSGAAAGSADCSFIDFAGSCVIHMVGGLSALVGAIILGTADRKVYRRAKTES